MCNHHHDHHPDHGRGRSCSGKCGGHNCQRSKTVSATAHIWLVAASRGRVGLCPVTPPIAADGAAKDNMVLCSDVQEFRTWFDHACASHMISHVILMGANDDLAWLHFCLGPQRMGHVLADICHDVPEAAFREQKPEYLRCLM